MRVTRLRRWFIPGSAMSLAVAATLVVIMWEVTDAEAPPRPSSPVRVAVARPAPVAPAPAPATRPPAARPRRAAPVAKPPVSPATPASRRAAEAPPARRGAAYLTQLEAAPDQLARLAVVEALTRDLQPCDAADALSGLLESQLPGELYEVQTLRLALLGALGRLGAPEAAHTLVARLDRTWPRQERLMAIEALSSRTDTRREDLASLAERDPDARIRDKARWALRRLN